MSDFKLTPASSIASVCPQITRGPHAAPGVTIAERTGASLCSILARKNVEAQLAERVQRLFNIELPRQPRYARIGPTAFVWAGPSQWLALQDARPFEAHLRASLAGLASVMDQSDGRTIVRIGGSHARDALAKGVLIDLHPSVFRPGDAAITTISHIGVHFWQTNAAPTYEFAMFRSFAVAFCEWLVEAAAEFGIGTE